MSGYYTDLTLDEQGRVLSAMAGLKLNASQGKQITRADVNAAFLSATGKQLSLEYMRDPSVVRLMSLVTPTRAATGAFSEKPRPGIKVDPSTAITDRNLAARGLPVPKAYSQTPGATRYSATGTNSRFTK